MHVIILRLGCVGHCVVAPLCLIRQVTCQHLELSPLNVELHSPITLRPRAVECVCDPFEQSRHEMPHCFKCDGSWWLIASACVVHHTSGCQSAIFWLSSSATIPGKPGIVGVSLRKVHQWSVQACLSWWPDVSPVSGYGSTMALVFVLAVAATKAIIEDRKRHREDHKMNNSAAIVIEKDESGVTRILFTIG
jgi:hypothetical protein